MKVRAYLYLPDNDTAFELLQNSPNSYNEVLEQLFVIKRHLQKGNDFHIYYDLGNISAFLEKARDIIPDPHLMGVRGRLHHLLRNVSTDVNLPNLRHPQAIYANWDISVTVNVSPIVIAEAAESKLIDTANDQTICLCFDHNFSTRHDEIHVIKDLINGANLPTIIIINSVGSDVSFVRWLSTLPAGRFSLKANPDFQPLDRYWNKERIYRQISTGHHWYFDYYHKDNRVHYEVFDATGETHLGEADENGALRQGTNSDSKKISNII